MRPAPTVTFTEPTPDPGVSTLTLGPVTMTFVSRTNEFMYFQVACSAANNGSMYPRVDVQFSTAEDGSTGYYGDSVGCAAGSDLLQTFNDSNFNGGLGVSHGFQLRWQGGPGTTTPWMPLVVPSVALTWDGTCHVEAATIRHGRDDPTSQPDAPTVTLDVWGALPAWVNIGTHCTVDATLAGVGYRRFAGTVTDLTVGWDTPTAPTARVIAAGELARMGSRIVGSTVMPQETDGARANRCITAAGVPTDAARTDPGTVQVLSRGKDPQDALSIAQDAAEDGAGMVWQAKDGVVLYADADHRRDAGVDVTLDACVIPVGVEWDRGLQGLVNDVTVSAPLEQHFSDPASITRYGTFSTSLSTRLASGYDAENLALLILARQADPAWVLAGLAVDLQMVSAVYAADPAADAAITAELLDLEIHDLVSVVALPAGGPHPSAVLWVEGWTETITHDRWRLDYAVADYCRNASLEIWDDVDAAITWDTADDVTWDQIVCSPPTGVGTWNDVPARAHWDTVPASITWNTAEDLWPS